MLINRILDDRTYEQRYSEALNNIPLYTKDWTNFNPSDPGITTLENMLAFISLQQSRIDQITPAVRRNLLRMVGMEANRERCAKVLLSTDGIDDVLSIPAGHVFKCGDLTFETSKLTTIYPYRVVDVLRKNEYGFSKLRNVLDREIKIPNSVFGKAPKGGDCLYIVTDNLPEPNEEVMFYVQAARRMSRNPFPEKGRSLFSEIAWEVYTEAGFVSTSTLDRTGGFLIDGDIRIRLPKEQAVPCPECGDRYCIRARLLWADYDVEPRILNIEGFLFELTQKDTLSVCLSGNKLPTYNIYNNILDHGYVRVFVKEEKKGSYREYTRAPYEGAKGRYYEYVQVGPGMHSFTFDKAKYGYGPYKSRDCIKIVAYNEEIMRRYSLDKVYGYDSQQMDLPRKHVVGESFCIVARREDPDAERYGVEGNIVKSYIYDFLRPGKGQEGAFKYRLLENEGVIVIDDPGEFIGAELFIGGMAVTEGSGGNIRAGIQFVSSEQGMEVTLTNPGPATGGRFMDTLEDVRKRFLDDIRKPYSAVTEKDYELIVKETPQLIIHKVKAFHVPGINIVQIAVKPGTDEEFPSLSKVYRETIMRRIDSRRLLNTRIEILGPVYVPVEVMADVYVKENYGDARKLICEALEEQINYMKSEKTFGEVLRFSDVFHAVESLDCVKFIYDLMILPRAGSPARIVDADIVPGNNCLCFVGNINLEISS